MEPKKNPSKDVHRYSRHFFLVGLCISSGLAIMAFEWETKITPYPDCNFHPPLEATHLPYEPPVILVDEPSKHKLPKEIRVIDLTQISETPENIVKPEEFSIEPPTIEVSGPITIDLHTEIIDSPFIWVEKMPEPIGGFDEFYKNLSKFIRYPSMAKRNGIQGKVLVEFVVNTDGEPIDFNILKGIGMGCDEEAIRVLKLSRWEPGKQRGRPVPVRKVLPVYFKLN